MWRSCKLPWAQPGKRIWKEASRSPLSWGEESWRLLLPSLQELSCHLQGPTAELPLHCSGASVRSEPWLRNVAHARRHFHSVPPQLQTWTRTAEAWAAQTSGRPGLSPLYPGVKGMWRTIYLVKYFNTRLFLLSNKLRNCRIFSWVGWIFLCIFCNLYTSLLSG